MSAEVALLLACARPEAPQDAVLQECAGAVRDWDAARRLAAHHRLIPLVAVRLGQCTGAAVPEPVLAWFEEHARATAAHNLAVTSHLVDVLRLLERNHITAMPIRGPVLALHAYGSIACRTFQDLDILIGRSDIEQAARLLESRGWEMAEYHRCLLHGLYPRVEHHYPLDGRDGRPMVELHCEATPWYFSTPIRTEDLFRRAGTVSLAGHTIRTLAPEDLLLILAMHGTKHAWYAMQLVADVAWALHAAPFCDWAGLRERAARLGAGRMLSVAMALARNLLRTDIATPIAQTVSETRRADSLAASIVQRLCGETSPPSQWSTFWLNMKCRERYADKAVYWGRHLLKGPIITASQPPFRHVPRRPTPDSM